jgi:predicted transcriptional regulator
MLATTTGYALVARLSINPPRSSVPGWYHGCMAMNLRLPADLDRRLDELAAKEHTSKSALLLQGAELLLQRRARNRDIHEGMDFVREHDAELLKRLEDA